MKFFYALQSENSRCCKKSASKIRKYKLSPPQSSNNAARLHFPFYAFSEAARSEAAFTFFTLHRDHSYPPIELSPQCILLRIKKQMPFRATWIIQRLPLPHAPLFAPLLLRLHVKKIASIFRSIVIDFNIYRKISLSVWSK